ncbi:glycosyl transferase group 1 [Rippkaea orientalis PCC 8801]|uniref:Glycosyl transferase group 1 n=1 Tax=Rippkaea orientalis (strain PCC 8801 / RF-1) TaxID=41431 RepID=B7JZJ2_RIPO1|nr:glycosyltransferase [Rippkaea orientalis]ACK64152.1 glycosyl transferase group 1 [Rippkaea orientalis PCC 8801]
MKIVIISELSYGTGASIAAFRLAKALSDLKHDVYYIVGQNSSKIEKDSSSITTYLLTQQHQKTLREIIFDKIQHLTEQIIISLTQKNSKSREILYQFKNYKQKTRFKFKLENNENELRQILETIQPDIINLHNISTIISYRGVLSLGTKFPLVWTLHDCFPVTGYHYKFINPNQQEIITLGIAPQLINIKKSINSLINASCNLIFVAPSEWLASLASNQLQGKKLVQVIPNGLSSIDFFPEDQKQSRLNLGLNPEKFYLLVFASNLKYERKNNQLILENLKRINELSIEVIACGQVDQDFSEQYPSIHLFEPIFNLQKIRQLYAAADIFLIPSLIDNLPNTVLESLFCGTPVLGANVGGIPEMVIEGQTGWLFDPYSGDNLITILNHIYQQRQQLPQIRQQCFNWVQEHYSIEQQVQAYLQLFQTMITSSVKSIQSK